jgi:DNA-directed RNA polymerase subunit K/omega
MVRLLGTRAKQISDGSKVFVKYDGAKSAMELAELELEHKIIPLKIKRPMPNGRYEIWRLSELEII